MKPIGLAGIVLTLAAACAGPSTLSGSSGSSSRGASSSHPAGAKEGSLPALAADTKMFSDPVGDSIPPTTGWLDTVSYGISRSSVGSDREGRFFFVLEVAAPVPDSFDVPLGYDAAQYSFCLDTNPSTSPIGYPFTTSEPVWCEFILTAVSRGRTWTGTLIDRRPLVDGGIVKTRAISFVLDDSRTKGVFEVRSALLGDPPRFDWAMTTTLIALPLPTDDFIDLDENYSSMLRFKG